jgi:hypothetical protein
MSKTKMRATIERSTEPMKIDGDLIVKSLRHINSRDGFDEAVRVASEISGGALDRERTRKIINGTAGLRGVTPDVEYYEGEAVTP